MIERRTFLSASASALALSVTGARAEVKTGGVRMIPVGGGHNVWTKRIGHSPTKVLLLHGGPGFSHEYLECFEDFLPQAGIEMVYYDQLGCGNSDHPNDDSLWTIARYTDEVEAVRKELGLENFILYGHSWGGMLAIEYALKYGKHLSRLVISDMTAGIPDYVAHANAIRRALPAADQATLAKYEKLGKTDDPAYQAVMNRIYAEHVVRLKEWPEPVARCFAHANQHLYNVMQGPNEFVITGNMKDWSRWSDLPKIRTPTLVMGATNDEMDPDQIRREGRLIPGAKTWISTKGSHLCMYDDQDAYFAALIPFLQGRA
jgi:proline iminopeptidase